MNDLIVAIHGAIAELVAEDPERAEIAARFLPVYAEPDASGWFGYAQELHGGDEGFVFPGLVSALTALADSAEPPADEDQDPEAPHPLSPPAQARLLLAIAMLARLDPEGHTEERRELFAGALLPVVLDHGRESAHHLLRLLEDDEVFPSRDHWEPFVAVAVEAQLLSADLVFVSASCTGEIVLTTDGAGPVEVAELVTECSSPSVSMAQVKAVLDPLNWHKCCKDHFCSVTDLGVRPDGWGELLEEVSLSCPLSPLRTGIEYYKFEFSGGAAAAVRYDLIRPPPPGADGMVVVDRGSIVARPLPGGGVQVRSSKQVRFAKPGLTEWMALTACLGGWNDVGQQMLFGCALSGGGISAWKTSEDAAAAAAEGAGEVPGSAEERVVGEPPPAADLGRRIDESVARILEEIDQLGNAWVAYLGRAAEGEVTVEDLATMTGDLAARSIRDAVRSSDLARRVVERRTPKGPAREEQR